jgi:hypothetical protein
MALPEGPESYNLPLDAVVALAAGGQRVYRVLRGATPGRADSRSDREAGRPFGGSESWVEHAGLSVYDDPAVSVTIAMRWPVFVAELALPAGAGCSIAKTGGAGHFTIWGPPDVLLTSIASLYRQRAPGTELRREP